MFKRKSSSAEPSVPRPSRSWPQYPPKDYLFQLDDGFQRSLTASRGDITPEDAEWYHTFDLPGGESIKGAWDLRHKEPEYFGGTDFRGKRVLELGPATGYLTFWMESQGADVVGMEAGFDVPIDLLSTSTDNYLSEVHDVMGHVYRVQNGWWYVHRKLASRAKLVHGSIYDLPRDIGMFDVAVFGAILLHLRDPYSAIGEAARRTRERIVITDLVQDGSDTPEDNTMRIAPLRPHELTNWWSMTPGAARTILSRYGFNRTQISFHTQRHHLMHDLDAAPVEMPMFTIVADRGGEPPPTGRRAG